MIRVDAQGCMKRLERVGDLSFATVGKDGTPQVRIVSAVLYEDDALYFFTARGKDFCQELLSDGRVQILGYTPFYEMIVYQERLSPFLRKSKSYGLIKFLINFHQLSLFIQGILGKLVSFLRLKIWHSSILT